MWETDVFSSFTSQNKTTYDGIYIHKWPVRYFMSCVQESNGKYIPILEHIRPNKCAWGSNGLFLSNLFEYRSINQHTVSASKICVYSYHGTCSINENTHDGEIDYFKQMILKMNDQWCSINQFILFVSEEVHFIKGIRGFLCNFQWACSRNWKAWNYDWKELSHKNMSNIYFSAISNSNATGICSLQWSSAMTLKYKIQHCIMYGRVYCGSKWAKVRECATDDVCFHFHGP